MLKDYLKYDDLELVYLIREGQEDALQIMFDKYTFLIEKRLRTFNIIQSARDDFRQEGLIALNKTVYYFREEYDKTFNKFYDMILQRRFISLLKRDSKYYSNVELREVLDYSAEEPVRFDELFDLDDYGFSELEEKIYIDRIYKDLSTDELSKMYNMTSKQIYNVFARAKSKVDKFNKKK